MRMLDIILKKKEGKALTEEELRFFITGYVKGEIPDYQVSSLLMAICFQGMNKEEIATLTELMEYSGETIDLTSIKGIKVDKHSTGGVGDKTSMVLGPLVASCGVKLAKMSGRGLGHTGGTLDKLESIPGMSISLTKERFVDQVNKIGMSIIGQTATIVPADKKLYALRDVTGTVESIPLIASSIMSKKLASGSDTILLDVKFGSGAFMKDLDSARELARTMVEIGDSLSRDTRAILTDMNQPLGCAIGNNLEVIEAVNTLKGKGPQDLVELCVKAGAIMLEQAKVCSRSNAEELLKNKIENGEAFEKLCQFVEAQGGDISYLKNTEKFEKSRHIDKVIATKEGYVKEINALEIGEAAMKLGAGRATKEDTIDMTAGIILHKKVGDYVKKGESLCELHTNVDNYKQIVKEIEESFKLTDQKIVVPSIIYETVE